MNARKKPLPFEAVAVFCLSSCAMCVVSYSSFIPCERMLLSKDDWLGWVLLLFVLLFLEINTWHIQCHSLVKSYNTHWPFWDILPVYHHEYTPLWAAWQGFSLLSTTKSTVFPSLPLLIVFFHFHQEIISMNYHNRIFYNIAVILLKRLEFFSILMFTEGIISS